VNPIREQMSNAETRRSSFGKINGSGIRTYPGRERWEALSV